jgi:hypothetical protein
MRESSPNLFLCAGLQSCGSTVASWCFLQRHDMNGVLDGECDLLPHIDLNLGTPNTWYKTTISSFRLSELMCHYQDSGWRVHPLLVVRDVRNVWSSLLTKPYGVNGFSAEDPPLRMRFRRFKDDWELFRARDWPILRYESLVQCPETALRDACRHLDLAWDDAMVSWPKSSGDIADAGRGSESFKQTQGQNLAETLDRYTSRKRPDEPIGGGDLAWLETEFQAFNAENDYPFHVAEWAIPDDGSSIKICSFQEMRRYRWELQRKPIRWLLDSLGVPDNSLDQRFMKKAG